MKKEKFNPRKVTEPIKNENSLGDCMSTYELNQLIKFYFVITQRNSECIFEENENEQENIH